MHPRAYNQIVKLSLEFRDPKWVQWLMRDYLQCNIAHLKAAKQRDMFAKFVRADIALKSVRDITRNLCTPMRPGLAKNVAQKKLERTTMRAKLEDAKRSFRITRNEMFVSKSKLNKVVRFGTFVRKEFMKLVKEETENLWNVDKKKTRRKFLSNKEKIVDEPKEVLGVLVGDNELQEFKENNEKSENCENLVVYANIALNVREKHVLNHPPDHAIYPRLNLEMIETEIDKGNVKCVWSEKNENIEKEAKNKEAEDDGEHEFSIRQEGYHDFGKKPSTEWKFNKRVIIPEDLDEENEIRKNFVKNELMNVAKDYIEKNCDEKGNIKNSNFDKQKTQDLKNIKKRLDKDDLTIYTTDKTGKFVIDSLENVKHKMEKHIKSDKIVTKKQIKKVENHINQKTKRWIHILNIGGKVNQMKRTKSNLINKDNQIPFISGTSKDHKIAENVILGPELRPIMGATCGPNTGLSQVGCCLLKCILEEATESLEVKSTEELLAKFEKYNQAQSQSKSQPQEQKIVGSMDIKSFYQSIDPARAAEVCKLMWNKSKVEIKDVNVDELVFYVAKEIDFAKMKEANLEEVIYTKKKRKYVKNVKKKKKIFEKKNKSMKKKKQDPKAAWHKPKRSPNKFEIKLLLGLALENLILTCMQNHIYQFNGICRQQAKGGPTGLDLTGLVADIFMLWWDGEFVSQLEHLNIVLDVYGRFKDDCNVITDPISPGTWFDAESKELHFMNPSIRKIFEEKSEIFENENPEMNTMRVLKEIANSIDPMIEFTVDMPSLHQDHKLPVLDLKVKMNSSNEIEYEFFKKATKNPHVILASSAISTHQKRSIFVSEALRRLRNTSSKLGPSVQNEHLNRFMLKLKESGYSAKFRAEIVRSAKSAYSKQLERDRSGVKPLFRNKHQIIADKKEKGANKANWWKRGGSNHYRAVIFVPPTPGAQLARLMQAKENEINSNSSNRIKVVEGKGVKLKNLLTRKNPFGTQDCEKPI